MSLENSGTFQTPKLLLPLLQEGDKGVGGGVFHHIADFVHKLRRRSVGGVDHRCRVFDSRVSMFQGISVECKR
ncbi:hypothetical protein ACFX15_046482 [Malus domestica]